MGLTVYATSGSVGGAAFAAFIAGIFSLPLMLLARELTLFRARRVLEPNEAGMVAEWISAAGAAVGARDVSVLYTYRRGAGIQVVQLGSSVNQEEAQAGLFALLHKAAWSALPAASVTKGGKLLVAVPARIMETLHGLSGRGRAGSYIELRAAGHARLVYGLLRELASAVNRGAGRVYASYLATKAFTKLLVSGRIRVAPELAAGLDRVVPWEPWWVRRKVRRQLEEEAGLLVQP